MYKPNFKNTAPREFVLNDYTRGFAQCIDNNWNYAVYAQDPSVSIYQNEYNAGCSPWENRQTDEEGLDIKVKRQNRLRVSRFLIFICFCFKDGYSVW